MTPRESVFFGGDVFPSSLCHRLPFRSWRALVEGCFESPRQADLTRAQFLALPKEDRDRVKQTAGFLQPIIYAETPHPRKLGDGVTIAHVKTTVGHIDIDSSPNSPDAIRAAAARLLNNPQMLLSQLEGVNFVAYESANSTPEFPRVHVTFECDLTGDQHARACRWVKSRLALPQEVTDARLDNPLWVSFLPLAFRDSPGQGAVFCRVKDAAPVSLDTLGDFDGGEDTPRAGKRAETGPVDFADIAEHLRPPLAGCTVELIREALFKIDPDSGYSDWLSVAPALVHQSAELGNGEELYALFDEWSSQGTKYKGPEDTRAKWDSFRAHTTNRAPVTIHTLFHLAKKAGWDDKKLKGATLGSFKAWLAGASETTVHKEVAMRIANLPDLTDTELAGLLKLVVLSAKGFSLPFDLPALKRAVKKAINTEAAEAMEKDPTPPSWLTGWYYIESQDAFFHLSTDRLLAPPSFNRTFGRNLLPTAAELIARGLTPTESALATPKVDPTPFALNSILIPTAYTTIYHPTESLRLIPNTNGQTALNTYSPSYPTPDMKRRDEAKAVWEKLIHPIYSPDDARTITDWFAHIVQKRTKIIWALFVCGTQHGAGKSLTAKFVCPALGPNNFGIIGGETFSKEFNTRSVEKQMIVIEELKAPNQNRALPMERMKTLITNETTEVEGKGTNREEKFNVASYVIFSNYRDALKLDNSDRRYYMVDVKRIPKEDMPAREVELRKIFDYCTDPANGPAIRAFFESHKISPDFEPKGSAPVNNFKAEAIRLSKTDFEIEIEEAIEGEADPLVSSFVLSTNRLFCVLGGERKREITMQRIGSHMSALGWVKLPGGRKSIMGDLHHVWIDPESPLADLYSDPTDHLRQRAAKASAEVFNK